MTVHYIIGLPVDIGTLENTLASNVVAFEDPFLSVSIFKLRCVSILRHNIFVQNRQFQVALPVLSQTTTIHVILRNPFIVSAFAATGPAPRKAPDLDPKSEIVILSIYTTVEAGSTL